MSEAVVGGREDCVAVSQWLSWDSKLWSGSFTLSCWCWVMLQLTILGFRTAKTGNFQFFLGAWMNFCEAEYVLFFFFILSDNLARFDGLDSLVNGMVDDTWANAVDANRKSTIQFADDEEDDEDDDKVRPAIIKEANKLIKTRRNNWIILPMFINTKQNRNKNVDSPVLLLTVFDSRCIIQEGSEHLADKKLKQFFRLKRRRVNVINGPNFVIWN